MMTIAATGHRPAKLGGYSESLAERMFDLAQACLIEMRAEKIVSGVALGWDQAVAEAAISLDIPFIAVVPFQGQEFRWPQASQNHYRLLLRQAAQVVIVSPGGYSRKAMQDRNIWMVDHCDGLLVLWDGSAGGTGNCIRYARSKRMPILNVWDRFTPHAWVLDHP